MSNQLRPQAHQLRLTNKLPFIYLLTFTFLSFPFPTQRHNASLFFSFLFFFFIPFVYFTPCWTCPASACVSRFLGPQPCGEHRANYSFAFYFSHFLGLCFYSFIFFFFAFHFTPGLVAFKVWYFGLPIGALSSSTWSHAPTLHLFWSKIFSNLNILHVLFHIFSKILTCLVWQIKIFK